MFNVLIAVVTAAVLFRVGVVVLRALAAPLPAPAPAGELRRVQFLIRRALCGRGVRMPTAIGETPAPPRHCMEAMELLPVDE